MTNPHFLSHAYGPEIVNTVMNSDGSRTVMFNLSQWIHVEANTSADAIAHETYRTIQYTVTIK